MKQDMIVILDLGCTENTATARAIRALGVYSEIYPHDVTPEELAALPNVKGVILNGGPNRVVDGVSIDAAPEIYACGLPVLAVCHPAACPAASCPVSRGSFLLPCCPDYAFACTRRISAPKQVSCVSKCS